MCCLFRLGLSLSDAMQATHQDPADLALAIPGTFAVSGECDDTLALQIVREHPSCSRGHTSS